MSAISILWNRNPRLLRIAISFLIVIGGLLVFMPGLSGPFVFDDFSNITANSYIRIESLTRANLYQAGYSLQAGPLNRPISMISFALNHYFSGSFEDTRPYKLTNVAIHVANGLLVFWLLQLLLARAATSAAGSRSVSELNNPKAIVLMAGAGALLWTVNPMQLTSVLYVVQRMTSLAALFTLAGLICYLKGRTLLPSSRKRALLIMGLGVPSFGVLGVLSKENAVLMPVFIAVIEYTLFREASPWNRWHELTRTRQRLILAAVALAAVSAFVAVWFYAAPGYAHRSFTMYERVLTQARALLFYISMILVPRTNEFGLHHDDFPISTSLLTPWTTLPAVVGVVGLVLFGLLKVRKYPLLCLGILWFFAGHLLESTIISLEIMHEHRNYLPTLGVGIALLGGIDLLCRKTGNRATWYAVPVLIIVFGVVTAIRSAIWSDIYSLADHESRNHEKSASALVMMGYVQTRMGQHEEAIESMRKAAALDPNDALFHINMHLIAKRSGFALSDEDRAETMRRLRGKALTGSAYHALENIAECIQAGCSAMQPTVLEWVDAIVDSLPQQADRSFFYYLKGKTLAGMNRLDEALVEFKRSYETDSLYLHPRFESTFIYLHQGRLDMAERELEALRKANATNPHPRNREIAIVAEALASGKATGRVPGHLRPPPPERPH